MKTDLGLLFLRVSAGSFMFFCHGMGKLLNFSTMKLVFLDPLGVGSTFSLVLAIFAEVVCSLGVMLGVFSRVSAFFVTFTMLVAAGIVHQTDPWGKKEFALLYAICFATIMIAGPGRFSFDYLRKGRI